MRHNLVMDRFALVSSLSGEELSRWVPICRDAMDEVASMVEESSLSDDANVRKLSNLAGVLAYYKYCLYTEGDMKSLTLGALSIQEGNSRCENARKLFEEEKAAISALLKTEGEFAFRRVVI